MKTPGSGPGVVHGEAGGARVRGRRTYFFASLFLLGRGASSPSSSALASFLAAEAAAAALGLGLFLLGVGGEGAGVAKAAAIRAARSLFISGYLSKVL